MVETKEMYVRIGKQKKKNWKKKWKIEGNVEGGRKESEMKRKSKNVKEIKHCQTDLSSNYSGHQKDTFPLFKYQQQFILQEKRILKNPQTHLRNG